MLGSMVQQRIGRREFFVIFSMLSLWFTPLLAGEPEGGDSPEAVFKAAQAAGAKKDFGVLTTLVAPSERAMLAFGTDMGVGMFVELYEGKKAAELKKKYQKIQKKYSVTIPDEAENEKLDISKETSKEVVDAHMRKRAKKLYGHVDAVKYVPELMSIMTNMPEMAGRPIFPQEDLTELHVVDDRATGKAGKKDVSFIREGGRWYLTADIMN